MNEPELEIGDEDLLGGRVVGSGAETGAGVALAVVLQIGEERDGARGAVDFPNRAGAAALEDAELAGHPARAALAVDEPAAVLGDDLQTEQRRRCQIDVGSALGGVAVERHAEHLANVSRRDLECRRSIGQQAGGRPAEFVQIEYAQHGAGRVDDR